MCVPGCPPADWQQFAGSHFIEALNSRAETFAGISYTEIYTHRDEVVQPDSGPSNCTSCLHTGRGAITNAATQDICPQDSYEHLAVGPIDPVAYAIALDALTHAGPAKPARIPRSVCSQRYMPGINPLTLNTELQLLASQPGLLSVAVPALAPAATGAKLFKAEPPLACYVFAACHRRSAPTLRISFASLGHGRYRVVVRTREGAALVAVPRATVRFADRRELTNGRGIAIFRVRLTAGRRYRITARRRGCNPASIVVQAGA
jgi:hypothetical protein